MVRRTGCLQILQEKILQSRVNRCQSIKHMEDPMGEELNIKDGFASLRVKGFDI